MRSGHVETVLRNTADMSGGCVIIKQQGTISSSSQKLNLKRFVPKQLLRKSRSLAECFIVRHMADDPYKKRFIMETLRRP